jgi:hypothetical protein
MNRAGFAEPRAFLVGPVDHLDCAPAALAREHPHRFEAAMTPSAPSSQPPFGTESRWLAMITVRSDAPLSVAQLLPAASISGAMPSSASLRVEPRAAPPATPAPGQPLPRHRRST